MKEGPFVSTTFDDENKTQISARPILLFSSIKSNTEIVETLSCYMCKMHEFTNSNSVSHFTYLDN